MNELDIYYRALLNYRAATRDNRECSSFRKAIVQANPEQDQIVVTRNICTVDEDWIQAIEQGLVFVEKALKEERQFIYSNGEVLEIEKVKHISKESVQHLAKHSNLITREQKTDDLIPDKLYSVERLNDYAVYENRFLYMLLCYLRDFVTIRYNKILNLSNKYDGVMHMDKQINLPKRNVTYRAEFHEEKRDDSYLREHNAAKSAIDRIDLILKAILAFLATPLMEITGKAPMLKPPITKTNVLKMDNNFKGALALYDYIIAYEGEGYTVTEETHTLAPLGDALREDVAEAELLMADLAYRYGLELTPTLKANLERDENETRLAELKARADALDGLRRRLERDGEPPEAYLLELEKTTHTLRHELDRLDPLYTELDARKRSELSLNDTLRALHDRIDGFDAELARAEEAHLEAEARLEMRHQKATAHLLEAHATEKTVLAREAESIHARHREDLAALREEMNAKQAELDRAHAAYAELEAECRLLRARVLGQRALEKDVTPAELEAMTEKEGFDELERELEAFVSLYGRVWKKTKRKIRKDLLNLKSIKGESGKQ